MQPPPSAAAPSPAMRQSPAPQQASWQAAPAIESVRQEAPRTQQAGGAARPIEVELPDGTVVEFPAGTSDSVIRDALKREFGHGLAGGASKASFADLMKATRRAHEAGDGEAARRLAGLAVKARDREQAQAVDNARQRRAEASSAGATKPAAAKSRREYHHAQDWTPGLDFGRGRPATVAERRAIFAACLRDQWAVARSAMKQRRAALAAFPAPRPAVEPQRLLFALDCADFHRPDDNLAITALRAELRAAA